MQVLGHDYSDRLRALRQANDMRAMAAEVAGHIPRMWAESTTSGDFWYWFFGELDSITRNAPTNMQQEQLRSELMNALSRAGVPLPAKQPGWKRQ